MNINNGIKQKKLPHEKNYWDLGVPTITNNFTIIFFVFEFHKN